MESRVSSRRCRSHGIPVCKSLRSSAGFRGQSEPVEVYFMRKCISLILCLLITAGLSAWAETPAVFASDVIGTAPEVPLSGLPASAPESAGNAGTSAETPQAGIIGPAAASAREAASDGSLLPGPSRKQPSRIPSGSMPAGFMMPVPGPTENFAGSGSLIMTGKPCPGKRRPSGRQQRPLWTGCGSWV